MYIIYVHLHIYMTTSTCALHLPVLYSTRRVRNNLITTVIIIITAERYYYCLSLCCDTKQPAISRVRRPRRSAEGYILYPIIIGTIV